MKERDIIVVPDAAAMARWGGDFFGRVASDRVRHDGRFSAALSGGSTPRAMHRLLAEVPFIFRVPWQKTHLFWVDERMVPRDDPASNYGAARADLIDRVPLTDGQVHPMPVIGTPDDAAAAYQAELESFFSRAVTPEPIFDLILLGLGTDGHTASLFPGTEDVEHPDEWIHWTRGGEPDVFRITMTFSLINRARNVCVLVSGEEKADMVRRVIAGESSLPAGKIDPENGRLIWLLDPAAASQLSGETAIEPG